MQYIKIIIVGLAWIGSPMPFLRLLDPETSHQIVISSLKLIPDKLIPSDKFEHPSLAIELWGKKFKNPLGLAAGVDKQGEIYNHAFEMGFGFVEIGSVTPKPQPGNPKPRIWRLYDPWIGSQKGLLNKCGFNSVGSNTVFLRLIRNPPKGILGINLGKNRESTGIEDYLLNMKLLGHLGDYIVLNISSPNTLVQCNINNLLEKASETKKTLNLPPILIKITPNLSHDSLKDIARAAITHKIDGIIISNSLSTGDGGLSGSPIFSISTQTLSEMYKLTEGKIPLIGVGGIFSGHDAYQKIKAGASLIQICTSFLYFGPCIVGRIKRELVNELKKDGYTSIVDAIGKK